MQAERPTSLSCSPTLNAYASSHSQSHNPTRLALIADSCSHCTDGPYHHRRREAEKEVVSEDKQGDDDATMTSNGAAFEFSFDCAGTASSPISADQIFHNGKIKPIYSVDEQQPATGRRRKPLRRLFLEETTHSSPSLSASSLESLPPDSYCVWNPNEMSSKKKASSKRWKLKDMLLARNSSSSNERSDGKKKEKEKSSYKNEEFRSGQKTEMKETGEFRRQELAGNNDNGSGRNLQRY